MMLFLSKYLEGRSKKNIIIWISAGALTCLVLLFMFWFLSGDTEEVNISPVANYKTRPNSGYRVLVEHTDKEVFSLFKKEK